MKFHIHPLIFFNYFMSNKQKIQILGYSGLLPFIFLPLLMLINEGNSKNIFEWFFVYSLFIYIFLTGSFWSLSIKSNKEPTYPILLFFLPLFGAAIFSFVFNQEDSLILALLSSFFIVYLYELKTFDHETYYQQMRLILSTVVIISHIGILIIN
tara:strand:+ start:339 stop:800 length:462 start_codon:yes stop_codon:yes gene_type:complete